MAEPKKPAGGTIFHVIDGESRFMHSVDMRTALARFPDEWKDRPWTAKEVEAYKKRKDKADA
jgi:hypothetical protein